MGARRAKVDIDDEEGEDDGGAQDDHGDGEEGGDDGHRGGGGRGDVRDLINVGGGRVIESDQSVDMEQLDPIRSQRIKNG